MTAISWSQIVRVLLTSRAVSEVVTNVPAQSVPAQSAEAVGPTDLPEMEGDVLVLRTGDLFAISIPLIFGLVLLSNASQVVDWLPATAALFGVAGFALACRVWASKSPHPIAQITGNFYVMLTIWVVYSRLNPIIDLISPVPYDRDLQAIDAWLFGVQPSVWLERFHHPWLTELLFICYVAFFFWQLCLGVILYRRKNGDFEDYLTTVVVFYMLSYVMYILVPAVGPRFDIASQYTVELRGVWVGDAIQRSFFDIPMLRDCFPSGHTGLTLLVLFTALRKRAYTFFIVMLPFGLLLIFSTLYCRFHYAVDLMCALPFITGVLFLQRALGLALPGGLALSLAGRRVEARRRLVA